MTGKKIIKLRYGILLTVLLLITGGCAPQTTENKAVTAEDVISVRHPNIYDSEDAAVVVKRDAEAGTIQLQNISSSKRYTLNYSGTTKVFDKNGEAISMQQLKDGSVVTVRFYRQDKSLSYIMENEDAFSLSDLSGYELDLKNGKITVGGADYIISGSVVVVSDGRETEPFELNSVDVISIWGYKDRIYGINVEKGHGYLRLKNEDYFVKGWLDVGDKVIRKIEEDMMVVVPEGTFNVMVSHKGSSAVQEITFARNEEMVWDLGEVEITVVQTGKIIFTLTPATAKMVIDGREADTSKPVELEYGLHSMRITADGYDTVAQYIKVAEPSANISVELEKSTQQETDEAEKEETDEALETEETPVNKKNQSNNSDTEDENENKDEDEVEQETEEKSSEKSSEEKSSEKSTEVVSSSAKYKVYIDAPEGVEAYLDGSYIGMTPVDFPKKAGSYVVTLRKTGCQTRSYTLQIDDEEKDINYSFAELVETDE